MTYTRVVASENFEMFKANAIRQLATARNMRAAENMLYVINDITAMYEYESEELETKLFDILRNQIL